MRMGAKKRPSYRIVVKENSRSATVLVWKTSAPTIPPGSREIKLKAARVRYVIDQGCSADRDRAPVDQAGCESGEYRLRLSLRLHSVA